MQAHLPAAKRRKRPQYPQLTKESIITKSKELPSNWLNLPLFGHEFALTLYNVFHKATNATYNTQDPDASIALGDGHSLLYSDLLDISTCLKNICQSTRDFKNTVGERGVVANESLKKTEISWTGAVAEELRRLISPRRSNGIFVHQHPTRNNTGTAETIDWAVARYKNGLVGEPIAGGDGKLVDVELAKKTTAYHSQNFVMVGNRPQDWPVILGFPSTPSETHLVLLITVDGAMWTVNILDTKIYDMGFLCTLYYGVHTLLAKSKATNSPIECNMPQPDLTPLKDPLFCKQERISVFQSNDKKQVFKYFDTSLRETLGTQPNLKFITAFSSLPNPSLTDVTSDGRVQRLSYDYILGHHVVSNIKQFVPILHTLDKLHQQSLVHSDVRLANMVFSKSEGYLIDFDLVDGKGVQYPWTLQRLEERHVDAHAPNVREPLHDRYSLGFVIEKYLGDNYRSIVLALNNMNSSLLDIISTIEN